MINEQLHIIILADMKYGMKAGIRMLMKYLTITHRYDHIRSICLDTIKLP